MVGGQLRHFGDKFQSSKVLNGQRYWRIPVMEGEFLVQEAFGVQRAIGGGNLLILAASQAQALEAAEAAAEAMRQVPGIILPFPGGIVRAGSKVGAKKYKNMVASTNDAYCPTLRGRDGVDSLLPENVNSVLEIVVDGLDRTAIEQACAPARRGVPAWSRRDLGGELRRQTRQASLSSAPVALVAARFTRRRESGAGVERAPANGRPTARGPRTPVAACDERLSHVAASSRFGEDRTDRLSGKERSPARGMSRMSPRSSQACVLRTLTSCRANTIAFPVAPLPLPGVPQIERRQCVCSCRRLACAPKTESRARARPAPSTTTSVG
jgi:hypothetical protein